MQKSVVFFGNEKLATGLPAAEPLIRQAAKAAGFQIEKVITGRLSELGGHQAELAVLAAYGRLIPQSVLDEFPLGIINVHPSLLPAYRGPTPVEQAILDGVTKTGVSIMKLTKGMDEGPIYKQKALHLTGHETKPELAKKLQQMGANLIKEVLSSIAAGAACKARRQPHPNRATYSRLITKRDGLMDWSKPAQQLEREIRAYSGWPGSHTTLAGKEIIITKARVTKASGRPGEASVSNKQLLVFCGQDALLIEQLKPAGKQEMTGPEFLSGYSHPKTK